jgi:hypothetical protein
VKAGWLLILVVWRICVVKIAEGVECRARMVRVMDRRGVACWNKHDDKHEGMLVIAGPPRDVPLTALIGNFMRCAFLSWYTTGPNIR